MQNGNNGNGGYTRVSPGVYRNQQGQLTDRNWNPQPGQGQRYAAQDARGYANRMNGPMHPNMAPTQQAGPMPQAAPGAATQMQFDPMRRNGFERRFQPGQNVGLGGYTGQPRQGLHNLTGQADQNRDPYAQYTPQPEQNIDPGFNVGGNVGTYEARYNTLPGTRSNLPPSWFSDAQMPENFGTYPRTVNPQLQQQISQVYGGMQQPPPQMPTNPNMNMRLSPGVYRNRMGNLTNNARRPHPNKPVGILSKPPMGNGTPDQMA